MAVNSCSAYQHMYMYALLIIYFFQCVRDPNYCLIDLQESYLLEVKCSSWVVLLREQK